MPVYSLFYGAWRVQVIDRNAMPMNHGVADSCRYMCKLTSESGWCDWPFCYMDGRIIYDRESELPRIAKRLTEHALKYIAKLGGMPADWLPESLRK